MSLRFGPPTLIVLLAVVLCVEGRGPASHRAQQQADRGAKARAQDIGMTIELSRDHGRPFRVGEKITIDIYMKNKTGAPLIACLARDLLQVRLTLVKDGMVVPYLNGLDDYIAKLEAGRRCKSLSELPVMHDRELSEEEIKDPDLFEPDIIEFAPHVMRTVSYLTLFDGPELKEQPNQFIWSSWYAPLQPGRYELTLERSLDCCGGASVKSNTINFEVAQEADPAQPADPPRSNEHSPDNGRHTTAKGAALVRKS